MRLQYIHPVIHLMIFALVASGTKLKYIYCSHSFSSQELGYMLQLNAEHSVTACRMTLLCLCERISKACNDCSATSMHSIVFTCIKTLHHQLL